MIDRCKIDMWIFMFIVDLLVPITMIGFGSLFIKKAPGQINSVFGYRSSRSMKNKETWKFAHRYCGTIWRTAGWIMLFITMILMFFIVHKSVKLIGIFGGILCLLQSIVLILTIIPVESALKKNFDEYGRRRS